MALEEPDHTPSLPAYYGIPTFMRQPYSRTPIDADTIIVGIPFDSGSTSFRTGARFAPRAIREASLSLWGYNRYFNVDPSNILNIIDYGDINIDPVNIESTMYLIESETDNLLSSDPFSVGIGGDHSISLGLLRSYAKRHGPVGLIQFDAHSDTEQGRMDHGTPFRHAAEEGLIRENAWVQIGSRGPLSHSREIEDACSLGASVFDMDSCLEFGAERFFSLFSENFGTSPVYITFDMDVVDPAYAPGVGTPEVGGFTSREIVRLVRGLSSFNVIGMDLVEVTPTYDPSGITSLLAATIIFEVLSGIASKKG